MSERYPGGIITKNPATPAGPYETGAAPGVWTLEQQMQYKQQGVWPLAGNVPNYIEDVFQTWLYTGTGATLTITNGIDLSGKGGLVWFKDRNHAGENNRLYDTVRGTNKVLYSNTTSQQLTSADITSYNATGFTLPGSSNVNVDPTNPDPHDYVAWTFREQAKFFDVVTYTGNGVAGLAIPHNLGSVPGCIIVKQTDDASNWFVYHRSNGNTGVIYLNSTAGVSTGTSFWNSQDPTSTNFYVGGGSSNINGGSFVAYIFAHDAGGFGLTGTDNVISCGSYTGNGTAGLAVTLGYEPQWVMIKRTDSTGNWVMQDIMRGIPNAGSSFYLYAQSSAAETDGGVPTVIPTATGFTLPSFGGWNTSGGTYIYIAIRRGPMKVPTSATTVFKPDYAWNTSSSIMGYLGQPTDAFWLGYLSGNAVSVNTRTRLVGSNRLTTSSTSAEVVDATTNYWDSQLGFKTGGSLTTSLITWNFRRAPGFFDVVCDTGTGSTHTIAHNLGVVPELMIRKSRSQSSTSWYCYVASEGASRRGFLNYDFAWGGPDNSIWGGTTPTSTVFTVGADGNVNNNASTYVTYLFATCAGVSKVGSYTGTGALQTVNCGFTSGARFVFIKRTDSTGDWFTYDSVRGITASDDPYLLLNSSAAQVTNTNYVDTDSTGFKVTAAAPAELNASGGTYIFLAIA